MANQFHSIEKVEDDQHFDTGCKPLLVHCNDLNHYVCKYLNGNYRADLLFREFIAASFLNIWKLQIPPFGVVMLKENHKPNFPFNINSDIPCFGSQFNNEYKEVDSFIQEMSNSQKQKYLTKEDFLSIAFFDIWVSNEDRHQGNYNLMLKLVNDEYYFVPIDHNSVFHTGCHDKENYSISHNESILASPLLASLFRVKELTDTQYIASLQRKCYICIQSCKAVLMNLIEEVPTQWQINNQVEYNNLVQFLFTDEWIKTSWQVFTKYLQLSVNNIK